MILDLALDGANGPDILVLVGAFQVATPLLLDGSLVDGAHGFHALDFVELAAEILALDILVKHHCTLLGHGDRGQGGDWKDLIIIFKTALFQCFKLTFILVDFSCECLFTAKNLHLNRLS